MTEEEQYEQWLRSEHPLCEHPGKQVGDLVHYYLAAPGVGHTTYRITRITESGEYFGVVVEDTGWVPEPESFR